MLSPQLRSSPTTSRRSALLIAIAATVAVAATASSLPAAPPPPSPFVEHLEPQSATRGQKARIAIVGSQLDRASGLWTSLPAGMLSSVSVVSSTTERTEIDLETAADCPIGLYGLRLAAEDGLSNLRLFAIDSLAARTKPTWFSSPTATPITDFPVALAGSFSTGSVDLIPIQVQAGQRLSFEVVASRFGDDSDPLIIIRSPSGRRIAEHDNSPGLFFDCRFEHVFTESGIHQIEVRDSRFAGSPHWHYVLRMGDFPAARVTLPSAFRPGSPTALILPELGNTEIRLAPRAETPLGVTYVELRRPMDRAGAWAPLVASLDPNVVEKEPNDRPEESTPVPTIPVMLHGVLGSETDRDHYELDLKKGDRLTFRAETKTLQSAADVELALLDMNGREVQRNDDVSLPGGALDEALLSFNAGQDGKYRLVVREATRAGGPEFAYRIELRRSTPRVQLITETAALTVPRGSFQIVPITATRVDYNGPIEIRLEGAPTGVTLESNTIAANANSEVCVVRAASDAPLGVHSFRLVGRLVDSSMTEKAGTAASDPKPTTNGAASDNMSSPQDFPVVFQPLVDRQIINVDLIKHGLRDNQRYLPPSTRESAALLVTEPTPFELTEASRPAVLPRYQHVELPLTPVRVSGFEEPITFHAISGGQLGEESQGRKQVFYRFPTAGKEQATVLGTIHSRSQANEGEERVDVLATARVGSRRVTLVRSVNLSVKPVFELQLEPATLVAAPGTSTRVKLIAKRLPSFDGPIEVTANPQTGITLPIPLELAAGQESLEFDVRIADDVKPRRERIRFIATAQVGAFQEEPRPKELDLDIKQPPMPPAGTAK
jgi:hypothetical protein